MPVADARTDPPEGDLGDRVDRLETGQGQIMAKLDQLIGGAHSKAEQHQEDKLGRPSTMEDMVRAELARKDQETAAKAEKDADKSERQTIKETLARLTEAKPVQPQPRRQRVMWGGR
jgi:hypothetical protein